MARKLTHESLIKQIAFDDLCRAEWEATLAGISDPRSGPAKLHSLSDILLLSLCATLAGAQSWREIEEFGQAKEDWLRNFLDLPNGIPSHDTIGRVFAAISPSEFLACFHAWTKCLIPRIQGLVAIDGKTICGSGAEGIKAAHIVSAFSELHHMVLGQVKTDEKSNEITAIPKLVQSLDLTGTLVSIDAMGCQRKIVEAIRMKGADYLLALKGNQEAMHEDVRVLFEGLEQGLCKKLPRTTDTIVEKNHGRVETRHCVVVSDVKWFRTKHGWLDLQRVIMVERTRTVKGKTQKERCFYISSRKEDAKAFNKYIRGHWSIENSLHWVLDVTFDEDHSRARTKNAAENYSILRKFAFNLIKSQTIDNRGPKSRRKRAGWDDNYLLLLMSGLAKIQT